MVDGGGKLVATFIEPLRVTPGPKARLTGISARVYQASLPPRRAFAFFRSWAPHGNAAIRGPSHGKPMSCR